jgi:hypothetical protein
MMPALTSRLVARPDLTAADCEALFALFGEHFAGASRTHFEADLAQKHWVILLTEPKTATIQGFSTLALYTTCHQSRTLTVVYSGDTIIRPAFWGTPELPRSWIQHVLALTASMPQPLYWLLISSGYKTYRFLSVFYREFYPRYDQPTPPTVQHLIDHLARERFGAQYNPATGLVHFATGGTPLRPGIADINPERLHNPHIAFFATRNPGHAAGDELVCLTQIHPENLTAAGRRMVRRA